MPCPANLLGALAPFAPRNQASFLSSRTQPCAAADGWREGSAVAFVARSSRPGRFFGTATFQVGAVESVVPGAPSFVRRLLAVASGGQRVGKLTFLRLPMGCRSWLFTLSGAERAATTSTTGATRQPLAGAVLFRREAPVYPDNGRAGNPAFDVRRPLCVGA
jgi:hypothetical protein